MILYIASSNAHKILEFSQMFSACGIDCEVRGASSLNGYIPPEEDGSSFAENAFIKARALKELAPKNSWLMADDSGLCVDALGGEPGIHSARYAGVSGASADKSNNKKLLKELENVSDNERTARFVCAIALISPQGKEHLFEGKIEGLINRAEAGCGGFGYDPLFYIPKFGLTTAELSAADKNEISHRGKAFAAMIQFLKQ